MKLKKIGKRLHSLLPGKNRAAATPTMVNIYRWTLLQGVIALGTAAMFHLITWNFFPGFNTTIILTALLGAWVIFYERAIKYIMYNGIVIEREAQKKVPDENRLRPHILTIIETGSFMTLILYLSARFGFFATNMLYGFGEANPDVSVWLNPDFYIGGAITIFIVLALTTLAWRGMKSYGLLLPFEVRPGASQVLTHDKQTLNATVAEGVSWRPLWSTITGGYTQQTGRDEQTLVFRNLTTADGIKVERLTVAFELVHEDAMLPYASIQGDLSDEKTEMYQFAERLLQTLLDTYFSKMNGLRSGTVKIQDEEFITIPTLVPGVTQGGLIDVRAAEDLGIFQDLNAAGYSITKDPKGHWSASVMNGSGKMDLHLKLSDITGAEISAITEGNRGIIAKMQEMITEAQGVQQLSELPSLNKNFGALGPLAMLNEVGINLPEETTKVLVAGQYAEALKDLLPAILTLIQTTKKDSPPQIDGR